MESRKELVSQTLQVNPQVLAKYKENLFINFVDMLPTIVKWANWWYDVKCAFPLFYKDIIPYVVWNPHYRKRLTEEFEEEIKKNIPDNTKFVELQRSSHWLSFNIHSNWTWLSPDDSWYSAHNVDTYDDAMFFLRCLSIFLPKLYFLMTDIIRWEMPINPEMQMPSTFDSYMIEFRK